MKIAIVTDAWEPQINGVVTTLKNTVRCLESAGHCVHLITPRGFRTLPVPTYPSIHFALGPARRVREMLVAFAPDAIHIATEGPLGLAARRYCKLAGIRFTTSYHTRFPEYIRMRVPLPIGVSYAWLRGFHAAAEHTLVATESQRRELAARGFKHLAIWPRGVDTEVFQPRDPIPLEDPRPIALYAGRVAVEKNLEAFLSLDTPGTKYVVGDGPDLKRLCARYPNARFTGYKRGEELARYLAAADVFVFPSRSDTFGLVMLEAMACGVPIAAYPVPGPADVVVQGVNGFLSNDLAKAISEALQLSRTEARRYAVRHSWQAATQQFVANLCFDCASKARLAGQVAYR